MIDPKLKDTWRRLRNLDYAFRVGDLDALVSVLRNAFIEAEWRRRKMEFVAEHGPSERDCRKQHSESIPPDPVSKFRRSFGGARMLPCGDLRHKLTDAQWRDELIAELENG